MTFEALSNGKIDEPAKCYQHDAGSNQSDCSGVIMAIANSKAPSIARLREVISYSKESGEFFWLKTLSNRSIAGSAAGSVFSGYLYITIDGYRTGAQRVAVAYVQGFWPLGEVDHKDADSLNNRYANLRSDTGRVNRQNVRRARKHNSIGVLGVRRTPNGRYRAQLHVDGKSIYSRVVETIEQASALYIDMKRSHHEGCTL
jgi:hypothetical protein